MPVFSGRADPPVGLPDHAQAIAAGRYQFGGVIGGAVIYHDQFERPIILVQDRIDGFGERPSPVPGGQDNADGVVGTPCSSGHHTDPSAVAQGPTPGFTQAFRPGRFRLTAVSFYFSISELSTFEKCLHGHFQFLTVDRLNIRRKWYSDLFSQTPIVCRL